MTRNADIAADLAEIYDTTDGEAVSAYYALSGQSLFGTDAAGKTALAEDQIPVIISEGAGNTLEGSDAMDMVATIRVQATGSDGIATMETGAEFYVTDYGGTGNYWHVEYAYKTPDGLEWICECSRLARINEDR